MTDSQERPIAELHAEGLAAYAVFYDVVSDPAKFSRFATESGSGFDDTERLVAELPAPHPALPLRLLGSLAQHARSGLLEVFYPLTVDGDRDTGAGTALASRLFRDWHDHNEEQLRRLRVFTSPSIRDRPWERWTPPTSEDPAAGQRLSWQYLCEAVGELVDADTRAGDVYDFRTATLLVVLRDWWSDLDPLCSAAQVAVDDLLARTVSELTSNGTAASSAPAPSSASSSSGEGGDLLPDTSDLSAFLESLERRETEVAADVSLPRSAWTVFLALLATEGSEALPTALEGFDRSALTELLHDAAERVPTDGRPSTSITSDFWTVDDALGFDIYADAITSFLKHRDTHPPLTIGIKGSWGAGKTSLMRMVRHRLDPEETSEIHLKKKALEIDRDKKGTPARKPDRSESESKFTISEALKISREPEPDRVEFEATPTRVTLGPTVWFNAWMYQSGEQVWAGLANAVIDQLTARLSRAEREEFWLRLQMARVDRSAIRRRIYRLLVERLAPIIVAAVGFLVVLTALLLVAPALPVSTETWHQVTGASMLTVILGAAAWVFGRTRTFLSTEASTAVTELVREPNYDTRLGFLHLVHNDMKRVLDLVADEENPVVVFVDDLDRCSESSVVQVIEAINLFLAGQFPNCVFILAMEPDVIAAHLEVAYDEVLKVLLHDNAAQWSSLGWRFLEKMIQLPLTIPPPTPDQVNKYLDAVLAGCPAQPAAIDAERQARIEDAIRNHGGRITQIREIAQLAERAVDGAAPRNGTSERLSPEALAAAERSFAESFRDDAPGVKEIIVQNTRWLTANPREIKRFINLFRFFAFIQVRRELRDLNTPTLEQVAKLAVVAIRWPHLLGRLVTPGAEQTPSALARLESALRQRGADNGGSPWLTAVTCVGLQGWEDLVAADDLHKFLSSDPAVGASSGIL